MPPSKVVAVVLTPPTEGYEEALRFALAEVRAIFQVRDLGIEALRPRRAVTGGLILEVPGPDGAPRADRLAEKLSEAPRGPWN